MRYVRCLNNTGFIRNQSGDLFDEEIHDLNVGQIYKVAPPEPNDGDWVRIFDESGEDYLYPADYFEPVSSNGDLITDSVTVHLDKLTKGILRAEALAINKSLSSLVREWIDERLDLPMAE